MAYERNGERRYPSLFESAFRPMLHRGLGQPIDEARLDETRGIPNALGRVANLPGQTLNAALGAAQQIPGVGSILEWSEIPGIVQTVGEIPGIMLNKLFGGYFNARNPRHQGTGGGTASGVSDEWKRNI